MDRYFMHLDSFKTPLQSWKIIMSHCLNCSTAFLISVMSPEGVEPTLEEGLIDRGEKRKGVEQKLDLTSGIITAFNTFKTQLEQHFSVSTTI